MQDKKFRAFFLSLCQSRKIYLGERFHPNGLVPTVLGRRGLQLSRHFFIVGKSEGVTPDGPGHPGVAPAESSQLLQKIGKFLLSGLAPLVPP
jgi:hypothetical protein